VACVKEVIAVTISLELSAVETELLTSSAMRLGVRPEELARAVLGDALRADREEFCRVAEHALNKNQSLYRRLA
jgi:hypothetical protein